MQAREDNVIPFVRPVARRTTSWVRAARVAIDEGTDALDVAHRTESRADVVEAAAVVARAWQVVAGLIAHARLGTDDASVEALQIRAAETKLLEELSYQREDAERLLDGLGAIVVDLDAFAERRRRRPPGAAKR